MTSSDEQTPQMRPIDPVLQEQFEIQMRSQYKWQANNTWLYWPFLIVFAALLFFGLANLAFAFFSDDWITNAFVGVIATLLGGIGVQAVWTGYKTASEMAKKLKQAEAEGR